ncbi:hypothetical protein JZ751_007419 [Albula glossodonta]|uniref:C2H2-type domain-containing protein n=1 Tax=Albula glossodonta TaxID=121402 RepID=A0A8T2N9W7_9TELE|nr:hypothetical protein JZ751_007419 [Albula glossodonta]
MSSEFTIDIQLTELGFPDLFQDEAGTKEAPACPLSAGFSRTHRPTTDPQTACSPSQTVHSRSEAIGPLLGNNPTKMRVNAPTHEAIPQSGRNAKDRPDLSTDVANGPRSGAKPDLTHEDVKLSASTTVSQKQESPTGVKPIKIVVGGRGEGGSSRNGGSKEGEQGGKVKGKDSVVEAVQDSEETEDSEVSEEDDDDDDEEEEEEQVDEEDDEEEEIAEGEMVPCYALYLTSVRSGRSPGDGSVEQSCRVCGLSLPSAFQLQEHMLLHSGARPYRCSECGKQFCHLANYRAHLRTHAQARPPATRCRVCEASFESEAALAQHLESSHLEKEFYQCDFCKRVFSCLRECQRHVDLHQLDIRRGHQCPRCDRRFRRRKALTRHLEAHVRRRTYLCTDCGRAFDRKNVLFRHSFSHLGLLPYTCVRCRRHFRLASLYHQHTCEPGRIQCEACLGFFCSQEDFRRHKEETGCWGQQGPREGDEFRCMECGQTFQTAEELRKHGGAHQRVLKCSECGKGFRSALLLVSHMGGHAPGQRPCLCQRCGLGFPHQQAYDSHHKDCGRAPAATVQAKKQKMQAPAAASEKLNAGPKGVWKLTLDKCPPPGSSLVMFLPMPVSSPSPGLPELASSLPTGSSLANERLPQTQAHMIPVVIKGPSPGQPAQEQPSAARQVAPVLAPGPAPVPGAVAAIRERPPVFWTSSVNQVRPSAAVRFPSLSASVTGVSPQDGPLGTTSRGSLAVPGTTLKLQISEATFIPSASQQLPESWQHPGFLQQPTVMGDKTAPTQGTAAHCGTAPDLARIPQVNVQVLGAPAVSAVVPAATVAATGDQMAREGRIQALPDLKQERDEEGKREEEGEVKIEAEVAVKEDKVQQGGEGTQPSAPVTKTETGEALEAASGQTENMSQVTLKLKGEPCKPIHLKVNIPASIQSEMVLRSLKGWDRAGDGLTSGQLGSGPGPGPADRTQETTRLKTGLVDSGVDIGHPPGGMPEGEGCFSSVEVELWDEDMEGDQEAEGEPHECLSCGKILLEGDLVQHYMQHAVESGASLRCSPSPEMQPLSSPSPSPPASPPLKRKLRPRRRHR